MEHYLALQVGHPQALQPCLVVDGVQPTWNNGNFKKLLTQRKTAPATTFLVFSALFGRISEFELVQIPGNIIKCYVFS